MNNNIESWALQCPTIIFSLKMIQLWFEIFNKWREISIGNSMICGDIWHKYHEWCFEILKYHEWYLCKTSHTDHAIICLYYYPQKACNFCRFFKLNWNTTALSQSNCRNFLCISIKIIIGADVATRDYNYILLFLG